MALSGGASARIFISYRRVDASWPARWLADRLAGHFGASVIFQDVDSIRPGDDFAAEIEAAVGACSVLLTVIGPQWLAAEGDAGRRLDDPQDWVRLEIEAAIKRGVRIIPVLVDGAKMPSVNGQVTVPAGGQLKVPIPRVDQVFFRVVPPLARASRMR
jgi:hypothetical protein